MQLERKVGIIGSRQFMNYDQLIEEVAKHIRKGDVIVSGGAVGADSMAQRFAKENGYGILIRYPDYGTYGNGAVWNRNQQIAEDSELILAFYTKERYQIGGTRDTIERAIKLDKKYIEFEER